MAVLHHVADGTLAVAGLDLHSPLGASCGQATPHLGTPAGVMGRSENCNWMA